MKDKLRYSPVVLVKLYFIQFYLLKITKVISDPVKLDTLNYQLALTSFLVSALFQLFFSSLTVGSAAFRLLTLTAGVVQVLGSYIYMIS